MSAGVGVRFDEPVAPTEPVVVADADHADRPDRSPIYRARQRRVLIVGAAIGTLALFVVHQLLVARLDFPGHADNSYYYGLAQRLHNQRTFQIGYTWHFLDGFNPPKNLPNDYWMPLPSVLFAAAFTVAGESMRSASFVLFLSILGTAFCSALIALRLTRSTSVAVVVAVLTPLLPVVVLSSIAFDGEALLMFFGTATIATLMYARGRRGAYAAAGALAALGQLTRQDGVLYVVTVAVAVLLLEPRGRRLLLLAWSGGAYLVVMVPLFLANLRYYGSLLPPGPRKVLFLTRYEDLFSLDPPQLRDYLDQGFGSLVRMRWVFLQHAWTITWHDFRGPLQGIAAVAALLIVACRPGTRRLWAVALSFPIALIVFDTLVTPVTASGGSWYQSSHVLSPLVLIASVILVRDAGHWIATRWPAHGWRLVFVGAVATLALVVVFARIGRHETNRVVKSRNSLYVKLQAMDAALAGQPGGIMTRFPWEVNQVTGRPTVQIPNGDFDTVLRVACQTNTPFLNPYARRPTSRELVAALKARRIEFVSRPARLFRILDCP